MQASDGFAFSPLHKEQQNVTPHPHANSHILGLVSFMVPNSVSLIKLDEHSFLFHVKTAQVSETRGNKQLPIQQESGSLPRLCLPCLTEIWLVLKAVMLQEQGKENGEESPLYFRE